MEDWQERTRELVDAGFGEAEHAFASPTAEAEWDEAGRPAGLMDTEPSSDSGYTASDVRAYLASREE